MASSRLSSRRCLSSGAGSPGSSSPPITSNTWLWRILPPLGWDACLALSCDHPAGGGDLRQPAGVDAPAPGLGELQEKMISRLMGLLLSVIGVQMLVYGLKGCFPVLAGAA